jgi:hypothetical protein
MKSLICLLVALGVAHAALPLQPNCMNVFCTMDLKICPDGKPAPIPIGGCCPSLSACAPVKPLSNCLFAVCTMDIKICPDGSRAPIPAGGCCPSLSACSSHVTGKRNAPLASLGSLLSGSNILSTLTGATHGTNLGTVLSMLNLLNNVHQLTNDVHQIPTLINQTLAAILSGAGQAGQVVVQQLIDAVNATSQQGASRNLLGNLGQSGNLLSSISHLLPQGTSITTILSLLNLLNNVNQLGHDVHQIPLLINQTLSSIINGTGQAGAAVLQQLLSLVGAKPTGRNLLGNLGQSANLLSSISHLLPQGTSITTILSLLNLLNNVNQLGHDVHQIPLLINQTLASILNGTGQAGAAVLQQLLSLVGAKPTGRSLLGSLGQNGNLLSSISHLLPQGTSITTVLSLLNLLNNVNNVSHDLHQIPAVLQETIQNILNGVQQLIPPTLQPVTGSF